MATQATQQAMADSFTPEMRDRQAQGKDPDKDDATQLREDNDERMKLGQR